MDKPKYPSGPTNFGALPAAPPGISDPVALGYQKDLEERRRNQPAAQGPPIPLLTGEAQAGRTMADQAALRQPPGSIFGGDARPAPGLLPQDLLPDEATKDPAYREGGGSRYAAAQPLLAFKYGVIRNGHRLAPQQLAAAKTGLSPATVEGLAAVQSFNQTRERAESPDASIEQDAARGPAGAAARLGNPTGDPLPAAKVEEPTKPIQIDDFDFNRFREAMMKDIINNEDQKKIIELRLEKLSFEELLVNNYVTQVVPIVPGKFEPEFQSMSGEEDLALKRLIMQESKSIEVSERYFLDKFSLMSVAAGLRSINKNPLPDFRDKQGGFNDDLFWAKFNRVVKLNFHMLASLGVNYFWFDIRVRKLFVAEKLGNG